MPPVDSIKVTGLRELNRELKKLDSTLPRAVREVNKKIADDVADEARSAAQSMGSVAAKTAPSIRALAGQSKAQVAVGGARYPFAMGAVFGSITYKQFKPWKGSGSDAGYLLYPTIRKMRRGELIDRYHRMLGEITHDAFPN